jgi:lysine-N-methylase
VRLPERPRLARRVLARRYVTGSELRGALHDVETGRITTLDRVEWVLLAGADGTRDLEGVCAAAIREGARVTPAEAGAFFARLAAEGLLDDGVEEPPAAPPASAAEEAAIATRPLDVLEGFSLHCDGRGSCCRFYGSVIFDPIEAARARALRPEVLGGGFRHEHVFSPHQGTGILGSSAVTLVDGRCAYLASSGRCSLHERGGPLAKPAGCRAFPATLIDDGETVRVSVAVECACVLASVGRPGGAPLVPEGARVRGDLDAGIGIATLPEVIAIAEGVSAPRAELVAWSRRAMASGPFPDPAAALFGLADAIERRGLGEGTAGPWPALDAVVVRPWIEALARAAARAVRRDEAYRSERDLALRAARWLAITAALLLDPGVLEALLEAPVPAPDAEHFYVRANLHGHRLLDDPPLARALRDRAVRLVVARAMPLVLAELPVDELDPAAAEPLALVEALLRGHGLDEYARHVAC